MNNIDYDTLLTEHIFESCINCGRFIRTKDKTRLLLFMYDHYGQNRRCKDTWYGEAVWTVLNWKYRNA